jgi:hypothetical protein
MDPAENRIFERRGDLVLFSQRGVKLWFPNDTADSEFYGWLDEMIATIGTVVHGAKIVEKPNDREDPRRNTGVYYDTDDLRLLREHLVLRTTSNPKTHAFCAFKRGEDEHHVRQDHRYVFDGNEKRTIQLDPASDQAIAIVKALLARTDIEHPGSYLREATGLAGEDLSPALLVAQYRRTFYVWLDGRDALRCSLDRVDTTNIRIPPAKRVEAHFSEVELPIFPRISPEVLADARVNDLIEALRSSLEERFGAYEVSDSKYRRAAKALDVLTD